MPVSRHTEVASEDILTCPDLTILLNSPEVGLCLVEDRKRRRFFMFNHLEYEATTLMEEYQRDKRGGKSIALPHNATSLKTARWRVSGATFFSNWVRLLARERKQDQSLALRKQAYFRAWRRGTRELDLILGLFAKRYLPFLTNEEVALFSNLLTAPDDQIYGWLTDQIPIPQSHDHKLTFFLKIFTQKHWI